MTDLLYLSGKSNYHAVDHLQHRFNGGQYYTWVGEQILLFVNPFTPDTVPLSLNDEIISSIEELASLQNLAEKPHIFTLAEHVYRSLALRKKAIGCDNQSRFGYSLIITGESGAGKTENMKRFASYLAHRASKENSLGHRPREVEELLFYSNVLLEALGNAKTLNNNNSSRFGKYVSLHFRDGNLVNQRVETYLLDDNRVLLLRDKPLESFHIFRLLIHTLSPLHQSVSSSCSTDDLLLQFAQETCLSAGTVMPCLPVSSAKSWEDVVAALQFCSFSPDQIQGFQWALTAVLLLASYTFTDFADNDDESIDTELFHRLDRLLGLSSDNADKENDFRASISILRTALTYQNFRAGVGRQSCYTRKCTVLEMSRRRDVLVKRIYSDIFQLVVNRLNSAFPSETCGECDCEIGVLDIFGFENLVSTGRTAPVTANAFEQLCINYANERLQQMFVEKFLREVVNEMTDEGLLLAHLPWRGSSTEMEDSWDNSNVVQLFDHNFAGVFALLNEAGTLANKRANNSTSQDDTAADESLALRLHSSHAHSNCISFPPLYPQHFVIQHFAGAVTYSVVGMTERNVKRFSADLAEFYSHQLIAKSTNSLITLLSATLAADLPRPFSPVRSTPKKNILSASCPGNQESTFSSTPLCSPIVRMRTPVGTATTVANHFKSSLQQLFTRISSHEVAYVRCLRAHHNNHHPMKSESNFDSLYVRQQLVYCGIQEALKLANCFFSAKFTYADFYSEFSVLLRLLVEEKKSCPQEVRIHLASSNVVGREKNRSLSQSIVDRLEGHSRRLAHQHSSNHEISVSSFMSANEEPVCKRRNAAKRSDLTVAGDSFETTRFERRQSCSSAVEHLRRLAACIFSLALERTDEGNAEKDMEESFLTSVLSRQFGRSRLYLSGKQLDRLWRLRHLVRSQSAMRIQRWWRQWRDTKHKPHPEPPILEDHDNLAAIRIQRAFRRYRLRSRLLRAPVAQTEEIESMSVCLNSILNQMELHNPKAGVVSRRLVPPSLTKLFPRPDRTVAINRIVPFCRREFASRGLLDALD